MRTEEQKIIQEPVEVILGGDKYPIKPLVIKEAAPWRRKFIGLFNDLSVLASVTSEDSDKFKTAMTEMLLNKPDAITNLFFEYTKLDREEIESKATTIELINAFEEVFALEAPFFGSAVRAVVNMKKVLL
jgi:hypothetical protein